MEEKKRGENQTKKKLGQKDIDNRHSVRVQQYCMDLFVCLYIRC